MPPFFSSRRGSQRAQPLDQTTASNATVAAASAFVQSSQKSTTSLSSAAAAAALRSHTSSPEPVGSIQTKRMTRRGSTASNTSVASQRGVARRPSLERSNSNGSMTERTFRVASPAEPSSRTMSLDSSAPPIPPIPRNAHKRSSSLDPPMSPTSPRGQSAERVSSPPPSSRQAKRLSNVMETEEADRPVTPSSPASPTSPSSPSRNFSRPMSSSSNVPAPTGAANKYTHGTGSWYTQASTTSTPPRPMTAEGTRRSAPTLDMSSVANRPVSKKRSSSTGPGSHLARANSAQARSYSASRSASEDEDDAIMVFDKNTRTFIRKPRARATEPTSPTSPRMETVYDPHTRSFVTKEQSRRMNSGVSAAPAQPVRATSPAQQPRPSAPKENANDPALSPPPKNATRPLPHSAGSVSTLTPQVVQKQPPFAREEPKAERSAESTTSPSTQPMQGKPGLSKAQPAPTTPHQRSVSLDVPATTSSGARGRQSPSPQRSAHFSPSPILKPERHVPLPRDASPVKSALKQSPASSVRTASPVASFSPPRAPSTSTVSPPSETSEGAPSQDGLDSGKKKKSVRVSFDERAQEIQTSETPTSPVGASASDEDDDDAIMKPRPALPSFGSVRRNRMQPEPAEKVTEMPPERHETSSDHAIGGILKNNLDPVPPEVTSKESAGYASDNSSESEVPAVTSAAKPEPAVAGAGLDSSTDKSGPLVKDFAAATPTKHVEEDNDAEDADVPAINLMPPTPGVEDDAKKDLKDSEDSFKARAKARSSMEIVVPGGWSAEDGSEGSETTQQDSSQSATTTTGERSSSDDSAQTSTQQPVLHASPLELSDIDEDTDDSAEFSDAVEDVSDLEGGPYASLDAIVESPIITTSAADSKARSKALTTREPPESPTTKQAATKADEASPKATDWGEATTFWSQLSREKREQMERAHMPSDDESEPAPKPAAAATRPKVKKPTEGLTALPAVKSSPAAAAAAASPQQDQGFRKTLRAQDGPAPAPASRPADESVHMRKSMRSGGGMASSLRDGPPPRRPQSEHVESKGTLQKKNSRPMSSSSMASASSGSAFQTQRPSSALGPRTQETAFPALQNKKSPSQRRSDQPQVSARLQKELAKADDSDSESSFRRRRRGNSASTADSQARFSMRRSMRGGSVDETPTPAPPRPQSPDAGRDKKGFRLRSMSPFGRKKVEAPPPRSGTSMSLRGPPVSKADNRKSAPAGRPTPPSKPRHKSRFADSDDSDDDAAPRRSLFRSRFADSDDDEPGSSMPTGLTPVRGIPRRAGQDDGDSTDLEDEEEDDQRKGSKKRDKKTPALVSDPAEVEKAMAAARRNLGISEESAPPSTPKATNEGSALAKGSLRSKPDDVQGEQPVTVPPEQDSTPTPETKKKRGFMGSFLRRNRNSASSVQQVRAASPPPPLPSSPAVANTASPQGTSQEAPSTPSSPSAGKLVRRTSNQPPARTTRADSDFSTATAPPPSTATTAVGTQNGEDWPLDSPKIPPVPPIPSHYADYDRPRTSESSIRLPRTMRPDLGSRTRSGPQRVMFQAGEEGSEPGEREKDAGAVYSRRTGKKKKFGKLRRAFGIDD